MKYVSIINTEDPRIPPRKKEINKYLISDLSEIIIKYYQMIHCEICHTDIYEPCLSCESKNKINCIHIELQCSHKFHQCCIFRWMKGRNSCPLDDIDIEFLMSDNLKPSCAKK
jgi:hypothetical protein